MSPLRRRPRALRGRTDHVVVVGAGLAGLSAALHLAGSGRRVTVLERSSGPGGRAHVLNVPAPDGGRYRFDPGPTVLTMPELVADCFDAVGERMEDHLRLKPVEPLYRASFADGSVIDVRTGVDAMAAELESVIGTEEAEGFRRYAAYVSRLYRYQMRSFIDRNFDSPFDLLGADLVRLVLAGGFGRLEPAVARYLKDERTRRLFSFQALYAGVAPQRALALYAVISYMDAVAGVWFPEGGMHALPEAMAAAAARHGVTFRYDTEVVGVDRTGGRVRAVLTADGERVTGDAFVMTPDLPVVHEDLLGSGPARRRRKRSSPSCVLMLAGSSSDHPGPRPAGGPDRATEPAAHHTILFGQAWREVFEDLDGGRPMRDPSLLVSRPTVSDPGLAPSGRHIYYVLAPTPNLSRQHAAPVDWARTGAAYRDHVVARLEQRGYPGFDAGVEVEHLITPEDWAAQGLVDGTPFSAAHTFFQTGPFRPGNRWGENVVLAGAGTRPGVGVPMVLVSGRLAAERITGHDPSYRSRAWP